VKKIVILMFLALLIQPSAAQGGEMKDFLLILRGQMAYPLRANIMERLVTIEASPGFWSRINGSSEGKNSHPVKYLSSYGEHLGNVAKTLGLGDVDALMYNIRNGDAPPIVAMVDSWKGKISLKIVMDFEPTDDTFAKTMAQTEIIANQLGNEYNLKPRGGEFHGTITYSQTAPKATVEVSPDGNSYDIVVPIYMATASNLSAINAGLKKGK
jgi:hypothetical protein